MSNAKYGHHGGDAALTPPYGLTLYCREEYANGVSAKAAQANTSRPLSHSVM